MSCTAVEAWGSRYDVAAMATPQRLRHIETLPHAGSTDVTIVRSSYEQSHF